jgi:2-oxoisovalerate dehydrogenase E1 component
MPKSQMVDPNQMRKSGHIKFQPIPVNQYQKSIKDELFRYSSDDLKDDA